MDNLGESLKLVRYTISHVPPDPARKVQWPICEVVVAGSTERDCVSRIVPKKEDTSSDDMRALELDGFMFAVLPTMLTDPIRSLSDEIGEDGV